MTIVAPARYVPLTDADSIKDSLVKSIPGKFNPRVSVRRSGDFWEIVQVVSFKDIPALNESLAQDRTSAHSVTASWLDGSRFIIRVKYESSIQDLTVSVTVPRMESYTGKDIAVRTSVDAGESLRWAFPVNSRHEAEVIGSLCSRTGHPSSDPGCLTVYLGGAGMDGPYIADQINAFRESCFGDVVAGKFTAGTRSDALDSIEKYRSRQADVSWDLKTIGVDRGLPSGGHLNLVGYSFGSLIAAQSAIYYADRGVTIDHLVLIGSMISSEFLDQLKESTKIEHVDILDLTQYGDPIHAGMSDWELAKSVEIFSQFIGNELYSSGSGHFYYTPNNDVGRSRRRELAKRLGDMGLRDCN